MLLWWVIKHCIAFATDTICVFSVSQKFQFNWVNLLITVPVTHVDQTDNVASLFTYSLHVTLYNGYHMTWSHNKTIHCSPALPRRLTSSLIVDSGQGQCPPDTRPGPGTVRLSPLVAQTQMKIKLFVNCITVHSTFCNYWFDKDGL